MESGPGLVWSKYIKYVNLNDQYMSEIMASENDTMG